MAGGDEALIEWLLAGDPAIRWQTLRDLAGAPESEWRAERGRVEHEGWGARLLACEDADGQWAGGAFLPAGFTRELWEREGQPWTATTYALTQLREFGLDPDSDRVRQVVALIGEHSRWDHADEPFWRGEIEECINGRLVADGAYFGVDMSALVTRLTGERLADGGWNCERAEGSVRSSFASTINVLEGLVEYERATDGGTAASREARATGEEYLLERHLFRRRSTGEPADLEFLWFSYPNRWCYDILRALDYFRNAGRRAGTPHDPRLDEAINHVRSRRRLDGRWDLDSVPRGRTWFDLDDGPGQPSRWITLRALRVLAWADGV